jgi:hypothetical protein
MGHLHLMRLDQRAADPPEQPCGVERAQHLDLGPLDVDLEERDLGHVAQDALKIGHEVGDLDRHGVFGVGIGDPLDNGISKRGREGVARMALRPAQNRRARLRAHPLFDQRDVAERPEPGAEQGEHLRVGLIGDDAGAGGGEAGRHIAHIRSAVDGDIAGP